MQNSYANTLKIIRNAIYLRLFALLRRVYLYLAAADQTCIENETDAHHRRYCSIGESAARSTASATALARPGRPRWSLRSASQLKIGRNGRHAGRQNSIRHLLRREQTMIVYSGVGRSGLSAADWIIGGAPE